MVTRLIPIDNADPNAFSNPAVAAASLATEAGVLAGTVSDMAVTPAALTAKNAPGLSVHERDSESYFVTPRALGSVVTKPGLWLPGSNGNYASTPDHASFDSNDLAVRARIRRLARRSGQIEYIAHRQFVGSNFVWWWHFDTNGKLVFAWSANGSAITATLTCSADFPGDDSDLYDVQFTLDAAAPTNYLGRHWVGIPEHEDAPWADFDQLGTDHAGGAPAALFATSTSGIQIGANSLVTTGQFMGHIYRFQMRTSADPDGAGAIVANPVFRHDGETAWKVSSPTTVDSAGKTWTLTGTGWEWRGDHHRDSTIPLFAYEGDSLTVGQGQTITNGSWWGQANALRDRRTRTVFRAVGSRCVAQAGGSGTAVADAAALDAEIDPDADNYLFVFLGTNDLYFGASAATLEASYESYCAARQAAGWKVVAFTILPRSNAGTPGGYEAARGTFNTWLRANFTDFADCLADVAANTTIGDAGDETNATYYFDLVHMTNAGYAIVAGIVNEALGTTFGLW